MAIFIGALVYYILSNRPNGRKRFTINTKIAENIVICILTAIAGALMVFIWGAVFMWALRQW
jgi:hypothetical protein